MQKLTESKSGKRFGMRMNALFALLILLLLAATFLLNAVALILSNRYPLSVDLTANAAYEIGDETRTLLNSLTKDITIDVLATEASFAGDSYLVQAKRILDHYPQYSDRIRLNYIDYAANPSYAASHADLTLTDGDIIISCGDRVKQITLTSMFNYAYTASGSLTVESSRAEEAITGGIMNVLSDELVQIGVLTGNGQQSAEAFTALLVNNNFVLKSVVAATDDLNAFDVLLLIAPQTDLSEDDIRTLDSWLYQDGAYGKTLLYTASVSQPQLPNLETFLAEWGVSVGSGAVFETVSDRTYQYQPFYPTTDYASQTYQQQLIDSKTPMLMPLSRPMQILFASRDGQYTDELLTFAASAGVKPENAGDDFKPASAEQWGPMPAMVLASRKVYENGTVAKQSNIIISASTTMLDQVCLQNSSLANSEYLLNLMNDLTAREDTVNIAPKSLAGKTLGITTKQISTLGVLLGGVIPLAILLTGVGVWLYRRYQ